MMDDHEIHDSDTVIELVKAGDVSKLRTVLLNDPATIDTCRDWAGDGLLAISCWHSKVEIALMLIDEFQANINDKNSSGRTPLHCAADLGDKDMLRLLCDRGADMELCDHSGKRPTDVGDADCRSYLEDRVEVQLELARMKLRDFEEADRQWEESLLRRADAIHIGTISTLVKKAVPVHISGCQNNDLNGVYIPVENHSHCLCPIYAKRANPQLILIFQSYVKAIDFSFPELNGKLSAESYWSDLSGDWVVQELSSIFPESSFARFSSLDSLRLDAVRDKLSLFSPDLNFDLCYLRMSCNSATFPELRVEGSNGITEYHYPAANAVSGGASMTTGDSKVVKQGIARLSSIKSAKYTQLSSRKKSEVHVQTEESVIATRELEKLKLEMADNTDR